MKKILRVCHKWVGLIFSIIILFFSVSGIIINHRAIFAGLDVSRKIMPESYRLDNYNNGTIRGTLLTKEGKLLAYGIAGVWETDSCFSFFREMNKGIPSGADYHKILSLVETADKSFWCINNFAAYRMSEYGSWKKIFDDKEELEDMTLRGDTLVLLGRSKIFLSFPPYTHFEEHILRPARYYSKKTTLFRTIWMVHSGELLGTPGKIFVDFIAIVLIILCVTGIAFTYKKSRMKHIKNVDKRKRGTTLMKANIKWHNRFGYWLIVFTLLIAVTGICLRDPLSSILKKIEVSPLPCTTLVSDNPFNDSLRAIRWDAQLGEWLLITSGKMYHLESFDAIPIPFKVKPKISAMGVNVFEKVGKDWVIGSVSGLYKFDVQKEQVKDYAKRTEGKDDHSNSKKRRTISVSGFSQYLGPIPVVFTKQKGADKLLPAMPKKMIRQPLSLWNFALELHTGRYFSLGIKGFSSWYVQISGLLLIFTLLSGLFIYLRSRRRLPKEHISDKNGSN
ncbi:MAG: PepSY domain-containing protein [Phocaeicola sp.]|uniref:PepSY-associated TM helix domain-containing protein n=1 Tax=Phocaeicola TaxID=909656 RepID=UPI00234E8A71|nr:PepSY-associated TM helix domain-containing protein [Phocaeicola oris]MCE2616719.1 PepSY domain-containing protein [Phocaeicola oris]